MIIKLKQQGEILTKSALVAKTVEMNLQKADKDISVIKSWFGGLMFKIFKRKNTEYGQVKAILDYNSAMEQYDGEITMVEALKDASDESSYLNEQAAKNASNLPANISRRNNCSEEATIEQNFSNISDSLSRLKVMSLDFQKEVSRQDAQMIDINQNVQEINTKTERMVGVLRRINH